MVLDHCQQTKRGYGKEVVRPHPNKKMVRKRPRPLERILAEANEVNEVLLWAKDNLRRVIDIIQTSEGYIVILYNRKNNNLRGRTKKLY